MGEDKWVSAFFLLMTFMKVLIRYLHFDMRGLHTIQHFLHDVHVPCSIRSMFVEGADDIGQLFHLCIDENYFMCARKTRNKLTSYCSKSF